MELHLPHCHSLKEKRGVLKPILHGARNRFGVAAAEVSSQDKWQRAGLGFASVSASAAHADEILEHVERFVLSFPEVDLLESRWGNGIEGIDGA
ncbi:MAG: DUF503 domain-containing protein [Acidimicrobiales bacterium]